jgi:hypothetical protein
MAIIATSNGSTSFEPIATGNYPARCYSMVHLGTVEENILGTVKKLNKVRVTWELPTELKVFKEEKGEQPCVISKEFTLSLHEKATLRNFLKNWRGKDFTDEEAKSFDIETLVGAPCMLNITHKPKKDGSGVYAEIGSVSAMPKGFVCPEQINPSFIFTYDDFDISKFEILPEFMRNKMVNSDEYKQLFSPHETEISEPASLSAQFEQDPPF